jgi:hypothetical protein
MVHSRLVVGLHDAQIDPNLIRYFEISFHMVHMQRHTRGPSDN